jgi:hypothetical protein
MSENQQVNDHLVLIAGASASGKSASLRNLRNPEKTLYMNCEAGKKLPFPSKFREMRITDPLKVPSYIAAMNEETKCDKIVVDSLTFLMDMYESVYVVNSDNTMAAWGKFAQFFKNMMQQQVAASPKSIIFTAHVQSILNEQEMVMEKKVPVKGSLKANGIEAYFSTVVMARSVSLDKLQGYENDLLRITPEEEAIGVKHVFQTKLTKDTATDRIRSSMGLWAHNETFIDNDAQLLLDRLHEYYG